MYMAYELETKQNMIIQMWLRKKMSDDFCRSVACISVRKKEVKIYKITKKWNNTLLDT